MAKKIVKKKTVKKPASKKMATKKAARPSAGKGDIIDMILADHKPLKKLIEIMKNGDKSITQRRAAFEQFAPLLITHAKPEEQVLYVHMKEDEDLREEGFEGDVEHGLADQMIEEAQRTDDEDLWSARVKVLAELVEHHIEEEEEEMLPDYRKSSSLEERLELGREYLAAKANVREDGSERNPELEPTELQQ